MVTLGAPILSFGRQCVLDVGSVPTGGSLPRRHLLRGRFPRVERAPPTGLCLSLHPVPCLPARVATSSTHSRNVTLAAPIRTERVCRRRRCRSGCKASEFLRHIDAWRSTKRHSRCARNVTVRAPSFKNVTVAAPIRVVCIHDEQGD